MDKNIDRKLLVIVLIINFGLFIIELITGLISRSLGLIADSIDMLADAFVYGLSLWAIGRAASRKKQIARISGYFQLALAFLGFFEVIRRFVGLEAIPEFRMMIWISLLALAGNLACLLILKRSQTKEVHIRASMIFTSNDILANIGVIVAAVLVHFLNSGIPDLVIGAVVFFLVAKGAVKILKLSR